jgi:hypothetical protein
LDGSLECVGTRELGSQLHLAFLEEWVTLQASYSGIRVRCVLDLTSSVGIWRLEVSVVIIAERLVLTRGTHILSA